MKYRLLFILPLLLGLLLGGCEDAADFEFTIIRSNVFTIDAPLGTFSYDVDLNTNSDYQRYKDHIKDVDIDYIRYSITANTGTGGKADFYANVYGGTLAGATKIAETISFAAGELRGTTDVVWLNKAYLESLLLGGRMSVWAVGEGTGVRLTLPVEIKIRVTANPLE
jgi:hypothetical protein